jgi:hypothetical protein
MRLRRARRHRPVPERPAAVRSARARPRARDRPPGGRSPRPAPGPEPARPLVVAIPQIVRAPATCCCHCSAGQGGWRRRVSRSSRSAPPLVGGGGLGSTCSSRPIRRGGPEQRGWFAHVGSPTRPSRRSPSSAPRRSASTPSPERSSRGRRGRLAVSTLVGRPRPAALDGRALIGRLARSAERGCGPRTLRIPSAHARTDHSSLEDVSLQRRRRARHRQLATLAALTGPAGLPYLPPPSSRSQLILHNSSHLR